MAATTPLIPEQRRQRILRLLRTEHVLSYRQLTDLLGVSQMTVRRDVGVLAEQGRLQATKGGVAATTRMLSEPPRAAKATSNTVEKTAIAAAAAEQVSDSMSIYLDAGTTVQAMRSFLQDRRGLTIVSNDLSTIQAFLDHPDAELICLGGRVDRDNQSMIGRLAALALDELSLDIAFLSCTAWDLRHGLTMPDDEKVDPKRAALAASSRGVLLADSDKFGTYAKYRVLRLDEIGAVITDTALGTVDASRIREEGIDLTLVAPEHDRLETRD